MLSIRHLHHLCLEDNTERSESFRNLATDQDRVTFVWTTIPSKARVTRDKVSGLFVHQVKLSGRQYLYFNKHPLNPINPCSKKNSVVKRMRIERIERISFNLVVPLEIGFNSDCICVYTTLDRLLQEMIRDNHSAWQAQKIQQHTIFFLFFFVFLY